MHKVSSSPELVVFFGRDGDAPEALPRSTEALTCGNTANVYTESMAAIGIRRRSWVG